MLKFNIKKYFIVVAVIVLLIFFHYLKLLNPIEDFLTRGLNPISRAFYFLNFSFNKIYSDKTETADLAAELKAARETINQLTAEKVELKFLEEENSALRKQLGFLSQNQVRYLMANVISRSELGYGAHDNQSVIIDKGARDGLLSGLAVMSIIGSATSSQGVIIGKVINVKDNIAEIYLVTNKNCRLAAAILGDTKTIGIASGELGLTIKMEFIPQTANIKVGDLVATSGLEQNIPKGLLIGQVEKVVKENNAVWQTATVEPQINLDALSIVSILLP